MGQTALNYSWLIKFLDEGEKEIEVKKAVKQKETKVAEGRKEEENGPL